MRRTFKECGFTLMEMLVVLVLIGLIAAVAIPQVMRLLGSGKMKAAGIQLQTVSQSLNYFQLDTGQYPTNDAGLNALVEAPPDIAGWNGPYVRQPQQLLDPWGRPLRYSVRDNGGGYELSTWGADGVEGGEGDDADVSIRP